ncbi:MAG: endolytic transglycosylase MltG [Spirochaetae bacterium HGW-Spirochaetae-2]|nr:MAG: endolytic transglycosylase MltG [Spirochaetae bacterium HGW-Spirochaetae-2]
MSGRREHTDRSLAEARARERRYEKLQERTSRDPKQMALGFDAPPPSRTDAQHLVEERHKQKASESKAKTQVVATASTKSQAKANPDSGSKSTTVHHARSTKTSPQARKATPKIPRKPSDKDTARKKPVKKGSKKKATRKESFKIQISLPVFIVLVIVFALLAGSFIALQLFGFKNSPLLVREANSPTAATLTIEVGMSARRISRMLEEAGVVADAKVFERYLEVEGSTTSLQPGTYLFEPGLSHALIAERLVNPPRAAIGQSVLVYDGFTLEEIDAQLVARGLADEGDFLLAARTLAFERGLPFAEGWFLSGTYMVPPNGDVPIGLAIAMQDALNEAIRPYLIVLEDLDISVSQAVVIASMIQRETKDVIQMPMISGVIHNRLKATMPLGIDATLRYGLDAWNRDLTQAEYTANHPYNTRNREGLPPSGIGAPSPAALDAAMNPSSHKWYYYIHDAQGNIHFAQTYDGHKENIDKYLR